MPFDLGQRPADAIAQHVLDRDFVASAPNQRWVADFTYLWTDGLVAPIGVEFSVVKPNHSWLFILVRRKMASEIEQLPDRRAS